MNCPSIWSDNKGILNIKKSNAKLHKDPIGKIFITTGVLEEETNASMVRNILQMNMCL